MGSKKGSKMGSKNPLGQGRKRGQKWAKNGAEKPLREGSEKRVGLLGHHILYCVKKDRKNPLFFGGVSQGKLEQTPHLFRGTPPAQIGPIFGVLFRDLAYPNSPFYSNPLKMILFGDGGEENPGF